MTYDHYKSTNPADAELGSVTPNPYPGLRPMSEAPHDREIIAVLADVDERVKVIYGSISGPGWLDEEAWWDADGDGAEGLNGEAPSWRHWANDELAGWLP